MRKTPHKTLHKTPHKILHKTLHKTYTKPHTKPYTKSYTKPYKTKNLTQNPTQNLAQNPTKKPLIYAISFIFVFNILGWIYSKLSIQKSEKIFHATLVQGNIGNTEEAYQRFGKSFRSDILKTYLDLSAQTVTKKTQLIIWPETAYPDTYYQDQGFRNNLLTKKTFHFLKQKKTPLLTGVFAKDNSKKISNAILVFDPEGHFLYEPVKKRILLAFGEYLPGEQWFPFLRKALPMVGDFERGGKPQVREVSGVKLGLQICYESLFSSFSRKLAQDKAQILINITNDSWYGPHSEPLQHLYNLLARSIETGLPILRTTNTGISALLMPNGEIIQPSPLYQPWSKSYEVPYSEAHRPTFYQRLGHLLTLPLLLIMVILCFTYGKT